MKRILTVRKGDSIISTATGKRMEVADIISQGREFGRNRSGERANISAFRIMANGQVMRRTATCLGQKWRHAS